MSRRLNLGLILLAMYSLLSHACKEEKYPQGKRLYEAYCLNCHMADGSGLGALYPALDQSTYLSTNKFSLPCLIKYGKTSSVLATVYMPPHIRMKEAEMSNLINYMSHQWGDNQDILLDDLRVELRKCP